jgi:hypothetical protein
MTQVRAAERTHSRPGPDRVAPNGRAARPAGIGNQMRYQHLRSGGSRAEPTVGATDDPAEAAADRRKRPGDPGRHDPCEILTHRAA